MAKTEFDASWQQWISTNVQRGCSKDELFRILLDEGFDADAITSVLAHRPSIHPSLIANPLTQPAADFNKTLSANLATGGARAPTPERIPTLKALPTSRLEIYVAENFLSGDECREIVELMQSSLRESTITAPGEPDKYFRVSKTCDRGQIHHPAVGRLDKKICTALSTNEAFAEPTQGQHYDPGGEFKPHTDTFEAHELPQFLTPTLGQRSWTFMIYLNQPEAGGETNFMNAGVSVQPRQGMAVIWNNLLPDGRPNADSMHHGTPVKAGHKDIITKWFRLARAP